jgi:hypothetical protein
MIPLEDCKHGYVYKIHSRNLLLGVFDSGKKGFVGIREKFGHEYLFCEYHRDTGAPYGTVSPEMEIEKCPLEDIREDLGVICYTCRKPIEYRDDPSAAPYPGRWTHLVQADCRDEKNAAGQSNKALFEYLKGLESREIDDS